MSMYSLHIDKLVVIYLQDIRMKRGGDEKVVTAALLCSIVAMIPLNLYSVSGVFRLRSDQNLLQEKPSMLNIVLFILSRI